MKNSIFSIFFSIALVGLLALASCKEDEVVEPTPEPEKEVLTADAGADKNVETGQAVVLDGSASKSSLGKPINFKWAVVKKPEGSTPLLQNDTNSKVNFTPSHAGEYEIELTVSNASGQSKDKVVVSSTPVAAVPDTISAPITTDLRLVDRIPNSEVPDYVVIKDIPVTAKLTIDPGVVIAVASDVRIDINEEGSIVAKGDEDNKIVFTGTEKQRGFWKGIVIFSDNSSNLLEHTVIWYAGSKNTLSIYKAALTLFGNSQAYISLKNCLITESGGLGMHAAAWSVIGEFSQNTFSNNAEAGIYLEATNVARLDKESVFSAGNGRNVVEIMQSEINESNTTTWTGFNDKTPYRLTGDLTVISGWKLLPGVEIEVGHNFTIAINTNGYLNAKGTETDSIRITGIEKTPGYWKGIRTYSKSALNELNFVDVSYGGNSPIVSGKKAAIAVTGANSTMIIKNSKIRHSGGYGILVGYTGTVNEDVLTQNAFESNAEGNLFDEN